MKLRDLLIRPPASQQGGVLNFIDDGKDYCSNFGDQWNRFRTIQIDSVSGSNESHERFFNETGWRAEDLRGKTLLDAGCGAGRFAEIALECGANLIAVDLSEAVFACAQTLQRFPSERYMILRADLFDLPIKPHSLDGVYSLGVLQHTPNPLGAIERLATLLAPGGRLATWIYEKRAAPVKALLSRTWIRALTANWSTAAKLRMAKIFTGACFPIGWGLSWLGRPGQAASFFLPYACRHHMARGDLRRQWNYCVMDTLDWYGPAYELLQRQSDVEAAMRRTGLVNVRRLPARGMAIVGEAEART